MANVVDALMVTLGLDVREYEKGTKKAEKAHADFDKKQESAKKKNQQQDKKLNNEREKQFKEQQSQNKATIEGLNKLRNQLVSVMTLFTAGKGIVDFAKNAVMGAAAVGRLAENADMAVSDVSGFEQALTRIGGSADEARGTIGTLTQELAKYRMGMDSVITEYVGRAQGGMQHGELSSTKNLLLGMADAFERMAKTDPGKALMVASRMGISENVLNLLKQGRKAVAAQIADGAKLTGINKQQADQARDAQKAWADLSAHLESVGRAILFPILGAISKWMDEHKDDIHNWIGKLKDVIAKFDAKSIDKIGAVFSGIVDSLSKAVSLMEKLAGVAEKFGLITPEAGKTAPKTMMPSSPTIGSFGMSSFMNILGMTGKLMHGGNTSTSQTTIGQINVQNPPGADANATARTVVNAIERHNSLTTQVASGVR